MNDRGKSLKKHIATADSKNSHESVDEKIHISIVVPLYNEEGSISELVRKIKETCGALKECYEIILVDDGSTDNTWKIIEAEKKISNRIKGIKLRRNFGQTSAMVAGFDNAAGRIIITLDGDLQNDPTDIPRMLVKLNEGYDIVSGWRRYRKDHFSRVIPSKIANYIISITTGVKLHDYGCSLKAYRAECIKSIKAYGEMHRFFPALASMTGARVTELPVNHHSRKTGVSKYGFSRIFKVFGDIFSLNLIIRFSSMPLAGFITCAVPFILMALFFCGLGLAAHFFEWSGQKSLFFFITSVIGGMAAAHLIFLGILAEMIVGRSDLTHTEMPELTKKKMLIN